MQSIPTFGQIISSTSQATSSASRPSLPLLHNQPIFTGTNVALPPYPQDIPEKIVKKILDLEYIDMADLILDNWEVEEPEAHCCGSSQNKGPRRKSINNILVWLDCYTSLVAVLCSAHPHKINHFLAYQKTIINAHQSFVGDAWIQYDTRFRQKAANTNSLNWGTKDGDLYNEIFTGRSRAFARCSLCLSETHLASQCPTSSRQTEQFLTAARYPPQLPKDNARSPATPLYNDSKGNRCTFDPCKFRHNCSGCYARHPYSTCPNNHKRPHFASYGQDKKRSKREKNY